MVPRIHAGGKSFSGIVEYLTHDAAIPGDRHPNTGERVGWVEGGSGAQRALPADSARGGTTGPSPGRTSVADP